MAGNGFQVSVFARVERTPLFPGVIGWRNDPEIALWITHDPVFCAGAVHEDGRHMRPGAEIISRSS